MKRFFAPVHFAATLSIAVFSFLYANVPDTSCVKIDSPLRGALITSPACTLSAIACDQVTEVQFSVQYTIENSDHDTIHPIATVSHAPFKYIWNTDGVPNQLYKGMSIRIEALHKSGIKLSQVVHGVFLANKTTTRPKVDIAFKNLTPLFSNTVAFAQGQLTISGSSSWEDAGLRFNIRVDAPFSYSTLTKDFLSTLGVDILLDQHRHLSPFPTDSIIALSISLANKAFATHYTAKTDTTGVFTISTRQTPSTCKFDVHTEDMKGYTITALVPMEMFGSSLPSAVNCNIVATVPINNDQSTKIAWNKTTGLNSYAPFLWPTISFLPKPFYLNMIFLIIASFIIGAGLTILGGFVFGFRSVRKRKTSLEKFELSEEKKQQCDMIFKFIEENSTKKDITAQWVASKINMSAHLVESLTKSYTGKAFKDFIMYQKIEIAKERLRSSHSSEKSIAESCGFKNINELEKYFAKFCKTTPYKFRKEYQVS